MKIRYKNQEKSLNIAIENEGKQQHVVDFDGVEYFIDIAYGPRLNDDGYRNKAWLKREYESRGRTMQEIATQCGVSPMTINLWLNKHGIETRRRGRR
jgi:hypothetical protein